jgi:hypothetical protein
MIGDSLAGAFIEGKGKGPSVDASVGVKDYTFEAKVGISAGSAKLSVGFNLIGLSVSIYGKGNAGFDYVFAFGKKTELNVGLLGAGVEFDYAKGNAPEISPTQIYNLFIRGDDPRMIKAREQWKQGNYTYVPSTLGLVGHKY